MPDRYPSKGTLLVGPNGGYWLRFEVRPGVYMDWRARDEKALRRSGYDLDDAEPRRQRELRAEGYYVINAGDASELAEIRESGYRSVRAYYNSTVLQYLPKGHPARDDPEVQAVLAELAANPDMPDSVFESKLMGTAFFRNQTEQTNKWNDQSPAEQAAMIEDKAAEVVQWYWDIVGARIDPTHSRVVEWAEAIVSGQRTSTSVTAEIIELAKTNPESPYMRTTREEQIDQRDFAYQTENLAEDLQDQAEGFGIMLSDEQVNRWAEDIMHKRSSLADFERSLEDQARVMYPGLPEGMHPADYAQPWIQTLNRVLETSSNIMDPRVQGAIQAGLNMYEFERQLTQSDEWLTTGNAYEAFDDAMGAVSRQMGFN